MPLALKTFGGVVLPRFDPQDEQDAGGFDALLQDLPSGGAYNLMGTSRPPRTSRAITRTGTLLETSKAALDTAWDALLTLAGTQNILGGVTEAGQFRWTPAILTLRNSIRKGGIASDGVYRWQGYYALDTTLVFTLLDDAWYGTRHSPTPLVWGTFTWDTGRSWTEGDTLFTLNTSPKTLALPNAGTLPARNALITVSVPVGGTAITALTLQSSDGRHFWTWTGTLAAGNSLRIATDARSRAVQLRTPLTATASAGATTLAVVATAGMAAGQSVRLALGDGTTYQTTIATVASGTSLTIPAPGLPAGAASGATVDVGVYSGFVLASSHRSADWLQIPAGGTTVTVTPTGGGTTSTMSFDYADPYR